MSLCELARELKLLGATLHLRKQGPDLYLQAPLPLSPEVLEALTLYASDMALLIRLQAAERRFLRALGLDAGPSRGLAALGGASLVQVQP